MSEDEKKNVTVEVIALISIYVGDIIDIQESFHQVMGQRIKLNRKKKLDPELMTIDKVTISSKKEKSRKSTLVKIS